MSPEATGFETAQSTSIAETLESRLPWSRHQLLGERVVEMDGFVMLEAIGSPYEHIREQLAEKIVDQDLAIDAIVEALDRTGLRRDDDHRPIANLAFLGPTGVGKSETAKTLATLMTQGSGNLLKIDCSSFSHGHEISALVGAPPGYVGRDQPPRFAKNKVEVPGTIVLFDEIEKGSEELHNLMLQIMGDGQLRLNDGDNVSFRETIIILTSNLGAKEMSDRVSNVPLGFGDQTIPKDKASLENIARKSFTNFFSPEFVNRLNKTVVFHPLDDEGLGRVLDVKLAEANDQYEKQHGVRVSLSDGTRAHLIGIAAGARHLGARPLIRALEDNVQSALGRYTKNGAVREGTHVRVVHRNEVPSNQPVYADTPLLLTAKPDPSIRKQRLVTARPTPPKNAIEFSQPKRDVDD